MNSPSETEIKIPISEDELTSVRQHLSSLGAETVSDRAEESNHLYDFADQRLRGSGCALRLRRYGQQAILTLKGPVQEDSPYKKRQELETTVGDAETMEAMLDGLGLTVHFEYRKIREIHRVAIDGQTVLVCLDETPAGTFVEVEGEEPGIRAALQEFGWSQERLVKKSYIEIYSEQSVEDSRRER